MERNVVWTERASGDIEAIVRTSRGEIRAPRVASAWGFITGSITPASGGIGL
jgi:hypothetical protein